MLSSHVVFYLLTASLDTSSIWPGVFVNVNPKGVTDLGGGLGINCAIAFPREGPLPACAVTDLKCINVLSEERR